MKNKVNGLACMGLVIFTSCQVGNTNHVAVGKWESERHALRVYADKTASIDGTAATWEVIDSKTIKLSHRYQSNTVISEFIITGDVAPGELLNEYQQVPNISNYDSFPPTVSASTSDSTFTTEQLARFKDIIAERSFRTYMPSNYNKRISKAKEEEYEVGTLYTGRRVIYFVRRER